MKTLTNRQWAEAYNALWRKPFENFPKEYRKGLVRGCKGKAQYESWDEAKRVAFTLPPREGLEIKIYRCKLCTWIHIGNTRFAQQKSPTKEE